MNATTVIAIYAAVVSTSAVGWEVYKWQRERNPDVRADLTVETFQAGEGELEFSNLALMLRLANRSSFTVRVEEIGFLAPHEEVPAKMIRTLPGQSPALPVLPRSLSDRLPPQLPADIAAHGSAVLRIDLPSFDVPFSPSVRGWVRLSSGHTFVSNSTQLVKLGRARESPGPS